MLDESDSFRGVLVHQEIRSRGCGWLRSITPEIDESTWRVALPYVLDSACMDTAADILLSHPEGVAARFLRTLRLSAPYSSDLDIIAALRERLHFLVPFLVETVKNPESDWMLVRNALLALGYVGDQGVIPALEAATRGPDFRRAQAALEARVRVAEDMTQLRSFLTKTAKEHYSCDVRREAAEAVRLLDDHRLRLRKQAPGQATSNGAETRPAQMPAPLVVGRPLSKPRTLGFPSRGLATIPTRPRPPSGNCRVSAALLPENCFNGVPLPATTTLTITLVDNRGKIKGTVHLPHDARAGISWDGSTNLFATNGGLIAVTNNHLASLIAPGIFSGVVRFGTTVYATGIQDGNSRILRVEMGEGRWRLSPVFELPGRPLGFAKLEGQLVTAATGGDVYLNPGAAWRTVCE